MKRLILIGVVLAMAAAACGDVAEDGGEPTATNEVASPASTLASDESSPDSGPVEGSIPSDEGPELEVAPVNPTSEEGKPAATEPPSSDKEAGLPVVDHPNPQVAASIGDLAARLGVDVASIEVVSVEEVTWRDGSIGCPQPGMRYTQALVNGSRIVLRTGGFDYQYNSGGGRDPFYCANPSDPVTGDI